MGRLLMRHFASRHFVAAIGRVRHRDHARFGDFRAKEGNQTDNQQSTQAGSAHDVYRLRLVGSKSKHAFPFQWIGLDESFTDANTYNRCSEYDSLV